MGIKDAIGYRAARGALRPRFGEIRSGMVPRPPERPKAAGILEGLGGLLGRAKKAPNAIRELRRLPQRARDRLPLSAEERQAYRERTIDWESFEHDLIRRMGERDAAKEVKRIRDILLKMRKLRAQGKKNLLHPITIQRMAMQILPKLEEIKKQGVKMTPQVEELTIKNILSDVATNLIVEKVFIDPKGPSMRQLNIIDDIVEASIEQVIDKQLEQWFKWKVKKELFLLKEI